MNPVKRCKECGNSDPVHSLSCTRRFLPITEQYTTFKQVVYDGGVGAQVFDSSDGGGCWNSGAGSYCIGSSGSCD